MPYTISDYEMERRKLCARAKEALTEAMYQIKDEDQLTPLEWAQVLNEMQQRVIAHGLGEEWREVRR